MAADFGSAFEAREWAYLAGLWHDLGKYSCEFQEYLAAAGEDTSHTAELRGRVDHSTAGARHAVDLLNLPGHLLAYVISGHHSGLLDGRTDTACLEARLDKKIPAWRHGLGELPEIKSSVLPDFVRRALLPPPARDPHAVAVFTRMVFSCLVDADFLDTERFVDPDRHRNRPTFPDNIVLAMEEVLDGYMANFDRSSGPIDPIRDEIRRFCLDAAPQAPGLFSLTVPTGGGKTLASLAFALRHARIHGLRRVIYIAPFITIIEQNADAFREALEPLLAGAHPDLVLEDHSNLDGGTETDSSRLAAENWEAPLVVTTAVQFYESLFANRTSKCRKLHRIARSVVILDEAQALPVQYLHPCLRVLRELAANYGTTIVLCTATQPAIHRRADFPIGLEGVREIVPDPIGLSRRLKRTTALDLGNASDADLVERLLSERRALCVVNTRGHAAKLFHLLGDRDGHFHLSARMCPEHRTAVLNRIKQRLSDVDVECRVISTQIVEAGVDISFPAVFRSLAGIDSIAQAAGRCNRNGALPEPGRVFVFRSEHKRSERYFAETASCGEQILALFEDPLSIEAVEHYFRLYFWTRNADWDAKQILDRFHLLQDSRLPFSFEFASVARDFQLIETAGRPMLVPWGDRGRMLCEELRRSNGHVDRRLLRSLQRFSVEIPEKDWNQHVASGLIELIDERYAVLACPELHYSENLGLTFGEDEPSILIA